jgi:hypothetical protein
LKQNAHIGAIKSGSHPFTIIIISLKSTASLLPAEFENPTSQVQRLKRVTLCNSHCKENHVREGTQAEKKRKRKQSTCLSICFHSAKVNQYYLGKGRRNVLPCDDDDTISKDTSGDGDLVGGGL